MRLHSVFYRVLPLCLVLFASAADLFAQKRVDAILEGEDKRKVERARKLFNRYKVYEGEKLMKELILQHPNEVYYHEALVQLQRQVLYHIRDVGDLLDELQPEHLNTDSTAAAANEDEDSVAQVPSKPAVKTEAQLVSWNGLDRGSDGKGDSKGDKKEKRREARMARNASDEPMKEAVMSIDSTLIKASAEDEDEGGDADIFSRKNRDDNERKKQLKLLTDLAQIPYEPYRQELIRNARNATRWSIFADSSSHYLRLMLVDTLSPDGNIPEEAREAYLAALDDIQAREFPSAAKFLEKAIALHPLFYSAYLKMGDVYYLMNRDTAAMAKYRQAFVLKPGRPDPMYRLAVLQYNAGRYTEAASLILEAILIYPENQYWTLLKRIMAKTGRDFDLQWIPREVYPLTTKQTYEEIIAKEKTPWWHYQFAKGEVYGYYDTAGMVRPNDKTAEPYLEVYGWKFMLNRSGMDRFPFARVMDDLGYLDCYVLVTLFHQDLYGQFADLVRREPEKVRKYLYLVLNWEDRKFDPLREKMKQYVSRGAKKEADKPTKPQEAEKKTPSQEKK